MPIQYFQRPTNWQEITEAMRDPSKRALLLLEMGFSDEIADYFDELIAHLEDQQARNRGAGNFLVRVSLSDEEYRSYQDWELHKEFEADLQASFTKLHLNEWMPPEIPASFTIKHELEMQHLARELYSRMPSARIDNIDYKEWQEKKDNE